MEVMALYETDNAIINDVEDSRFVQHLQGFLIFRTRLKPQQRHGIGGLAEEEVAHGFSCPKRSEKEDHHFEMRLVLKGGTDWPSQNTPSGIAWMNRNQPPAPLVEVVNGPMCWSFCIDSSPQNVDAGGVLNRAQNGRVSVSEHGM